MSETKSNKQNRKKAQKRIKNIRNIIMMTLLCVMMMSAATYAWFTLSQSTRVTNITMTVGDESGLLIAPDGSSTTRTGTAGPFGSVLKFDDGTYGYKIKFPLNPATMQTAGTILKPHYKEEDGSVDSVEALGSKETMRDASTDNTVKYYCYETTFFLKAAGSQNVDVRLKPSSFSNGGVSGADNGTGTYVLNSSTASTGARAIRIQLTDGTNSIFYQPLSDYSDSNTRTYAADSREDKTTVAMTDVQLLDGTFAKNDGKLVVTHEPAGTKITMRIWLEGTDSLGGKNYCANEIMSNEFLAQLAFEVIPAAETP